MKYQLSILRCANSGKLFIGKMGRIYVLKKKKIFICIKSVLKNPCNKLTLRSSNKAEIQNQNHSVSETNSWASILFTPLLNSQQYPVPYLPIRTSKVSSLEQSPSQENVANH